MSQKKRKQITTACLTFGAIWALGAAAYPARAQTASPVPTDPPVAEDPAARTEVNLATPDIDIADPQNPTVPPVAIPGTAQIAPFQQPKAESLTPQAGVPVLRDIPIIGNLFRSNGQNSAMAVKTRRILALREMLKLGLSADDIAKALPLLRRLRDAESQPPANPEKALEDEYQALLRAKPGDPLPQSSAMKLQDAAKFYREEQTTAWSELTKQIGEKKAQGLRDLVGQSTFYFSGIGSNTQGVISGYRPAMTTYQQGVTTVRPGSAVPYGLSVTPDRVTDPAFSLKPGEGQDTRIYLDASKPGQGKRRGTRSGDSRSDPAIPNIKALSSSVDVTIPQEYGQQIAPGTTSIPSAALAQSSQPALRGNRRVGITAPTTWTNRDVKATGLSPYNYVAEYVTTPLNARLTLSELIELMEQKLAAMRVPKVSVNWTPERYMSLSYTLTTSVTPQKETLNKLRYPLQMEYHLIPTAPTGR